jgi:uncharacterized protein YqhQ
MERIPFLRGILRLVLSVADFLDGVAESAQLMPQQIVRGTRFEQRFAELFRVRPTSLVAAGSALVILLMLAGLVLAGPWALTRFVLPLLPRLELSRAGVNAVGCAFRVLAGLLCVLVIPRLRVVNRFCMYRGAINKVLNAREAQRRAPTVEDAMAASRVYRRSDAAFLTVVLAVTPEVTCWRVTVVPPTTLAASPPP